MLSHVGARRAATDWIIAAGLSAVAVLPRIPYVALVPRFDDEVTETILTLGIRPGNWPLVGMDAYAGPFFYYVLAACLWLFGPTAAAPRLVILGMGALTVGLTYALARVSGLGRVWAALAGLLLLANPHHILINSHMAGTSYTVPFFGAAFFIALTLAVRRASGPWLVAAGALVGLSLNNPMFSVVLPGAALWFLAQRPARIGLKTRWPYLGALAFLLVYAPVIIYNIQNQFEGVSLAGVERSYIWQPDPTWQTYTENIARLALQLARQASGVLMGSDGISSLLGLPLVLALWALAALVVVTPLKGMFHRRGISLPLFAVASQVIIMPWFSNHYGMTITTRFTNQLTPLLCVAMAALAALAWDWAAARMPRASVRRLAGALTAGLLIALSVQPLTALAAYYRHEEARGETNALHFALADEFMRQWRGERLVLSLTNWYSVAEYFFAVNRVPYTTMPVGHLLEQLATGRESGPVIVMLYNDDVPLVAAQTDLIEWQTPAMRAAPQRLGYSLYTIPDAGRVRKPPFVVRADHAADDALAVPDVRRVQAAFAGAERGSAQLGLIGYRLSSDRLPENGQLTVNVFWTALAPMPEAYIGFVHLVGPDGQVAAQDDHELGRGVYRTLAWSAGEIIREKYELKLPANRPRGEYRVRVGAYRFPSLERLPAQSQTLPVQDNVVELTTIVARP